MRRTWPRWAGSQYRRGRSRRWRRDWLRYGAAGLVACDTAPQHRGARDSLQRADTRLQQYRSVVDAHDHVVSDSSSAEHSETCVQSLTAGRRDLDCYRNRRRASHQKAQQRLVVLGLIASENTRRRDCSRWSVRQRVTKKVGRDPAWKVRQKRRPDAALVEKMLAALAWQKTKPAGSRRKAGTSRVRRSGSTQDAGR
jgi:hypothetical protein